MSVTNLPPVVLGYFGWFDDNPKKSQHEKLQEALYAFVERYHIKPTIVCVSEFDMGLVFKNVVIHNANKEVRPNTYYVGSNDENPEYYENQPITVPEPVVIEKKSKKKPAPVVVIAESAPVLEEVSALQADWVNEGQDEPLVLMLDNSEEEDEEEPITFFASRRH